LHQSFGRYQNYLYNYSILFKFQAFSNFRRPVLITLNFSMLFCFCKINNKLWILLINHSPKIFFCVWKRSLSSYKGLIIRLKYRIDIISIDVRVRNIIASLNQFDSCVHERLKIRVSVHILPELFLILQMLFCLCQFSYKSKFCV
jgi:hypothetical protein